MTAAVIWVIGFWFTVTLTGATTAKKSIQASFLCILLWPFVLGDFCREKLDKK